MQEDMRYGSDYHVIPAVSIKSGTGVEVLKDVYCYTDQIVNLVLFGEPGRGSFVLVDAGMPCSAKEIISVAEARFGAGCRPEAILLTHGHFDHVGSLIDLVEHWEVPVYAHPAELPYLNGTESYPEPDPTVEGGWIAKMSPIFPNEPIDLGDRLRLLPADGLVPYMEGFRWIHTPGHSPGHISLFRAEDRALIAGDAFVTVRQDELYKVLTQKLEICGPPRYLTTDWAAAKESVKKLADLNPAVAVTGHGIPVSGSELSEGLKRLTAEFEWLAVPDYGKYVN
ncbi:MBL fold metallo-hydrolase [Paenibacillus apis]|uniref:MBL fold metallo-hydrolase n=1 Tax=Paenibacillus apis TaxID=1792174 RepID=A0A919Y1C0_9BACL|nr:MBL fold metallo-hydrolase [Paenibacillus apis]GIO43071.1 MBL fold metallo-hydrolase [Paenibacillus apis]